MRFALMTFGTRGDVQPLIALGLRLSAAGHEVVLGASAEFEDEVRRRGLEFRTVGLDIEAVLRRHASLLTGRSLESLRSLVDALREDTRLSFDQIHEAARGADLMVSGVHASAPSVAEALGIPHRTLLFCPQMLRSSHHPPPGVPWFSLPGPLNELLWGWASHGLEMALADAIQQGRRRFGLPPIGRMSDYLCGERPLLACDPLLGEPPEDALDVEQTGALCLEDSEPLDPALEHFLACGEPPVAVGFGSMPDPDPRRTTSAIVEALASCSKRGVILSGWARLGAGGVPPGIFVAPSAPHRALLPRVAMAVHHGGAGTTAAAARAGVPQIVVPHAADQFYWGDQIHRRGLGARPIPRAGLSAARLALAIHDVVSDPGIAERARQVAEVLARADGASQAAHLLTRQIADAAAIREAA